MEMNIGGGIYQMSVLADPDTGQPISRRTTTINRSGSIQQAGQAQWLMPAADDRNGFWFQNHSAEELWINDLGPASPAPPSMMIPAGAFYESPMSGVPNTAISVYGGSADLAFSAREW